MLARICITLLGALTLINLSAQNELRILNERDYLDWKSIEKPQISNDGQWIAYELNPGEGDGKLVLFDHLTSESKTFDRGRIHGFDQSENKLVFTINPEKLVLDSLKLRKREEEELPGDTMVIYDLTQKSSLRLSPVSKVIKPEHWGGHLLAEIDAEKDTIWTSKLSRALEEKEKILLHFDLVNNSIDTLYFVKSYALAKHAPALLVSQGAPDTTNLEQVVWYDWQNKVEETIYKGQGEIAAANLSWNGDRCAFLTYADSQRHADSLRLVYWTKTLSAAKIIQPYQIPGIPNSWIIPEEQEMRFSALGDRLLFGTTPKPLEKDTTKLDEDMANVEIWTYHDTRLYPQQLVEADKDKKKSFKHAFDTRTFTITTLTTPEYPEAVINKDWNSSHLLALNSKPYLTSSSWEGRYYYDLYQVDADDGDAQLIKRKISGKPVLSPAGKYGLWYDEVDSCYYTVQLNKGQIHNISGNLELYDELNDRPDHPNNYGIMGWSADDTVVYIYDRYDIWSLSPVGERPPRKLTTGRDLKKRHRYLRLDPDELHLPSKVFLHLFNEETREEGIASLDLLTDEYQILIASPKKIRTQIIKAKKSSNLIFTSEDFNDFPDLHLTTTSFAEVEKISHANPQQKDYRWGTIEIFSWVDYDGIEREGLLVKPSDFDASKEYPLIVNFYERSSHRLHDHRPPVPGRSTIGYAFYASNGYVIFNPDVYYKVGAPGQSAYDAVVSGTKALLKEGFIDSTRMGLQGHSWGGYQIADILTKTDLFACAEAGAPVVNMTSAYGGIRWGSGRSRMFQYERTQSRLGATLWENREVYLKNSPLFNLDKVNTPVLILHNDKDGAVPWYQGIEYFVGLRRLGKPAWLLNYYDEPHWPLKWPNKLDFNKRMLQFFDHFLKGAPQPLWMKEGIPALEKGKNYGFELSRE